MKQEEAVGKKKRRSIREGIPMKTISVRLPAPLIEDLKKVALEEDRSFVGQLAHAMRLNIAEHDKKQK